MKKTTKFALCALSLCLLSGCKSDGNRAEVSVTNLPYTARREASGGKKSNVSPDEEAELDMVRRLEKECPSIEIRADEPGYSPESFIAKAAVGKLPTFYNVWLSEAKKIAQAGFAADLTEVFEKNGYADNMNSKIKELVTVDGRYYGFPTDIYCMGLQINAELFRQAGLVDENGETLLPKTYDELAEFAALIKEKTGKYGFGIPTANHDGGWVFMNIAWSYGTEFMRCENGKWIAAFDSDECEAAFKWLYDLRWKRNAVLYDGVNGVSELKKAYASGELAMFISSGGTFDVCTDGLGMNRNDIIMASLPAGPAGRKALLGGTLFMISSDASPEQTEACIKWAQLCGYTPVLDKHRKEIIEKQLKINSSKGYVIGCASPEVWINDEYKKDLEEIQSKYVNVDLKHFEDYNNFQNVEFVPEEPFNCQELYGILDKCIKKILSDENCNIREIISEANREFRENYPDTVK